MGSHQSSRGMNLENGWLYLTQHFHSISSDNINIIIRKPLICCKASTLHIPVQHWWLMKVSAFKTISMNKEDKKKCPQYSLNVRKVISLLWTLYVFSPFDLAYLSYIFCKTARPWNYLFIPPPWPMPLLSRREAQMRQVHWPWLGKGSNLASKNLYSILEFDWNWKGSLKKLVQIIESVFLSRWCDTSQSENRRFGKLDILRYRLLVLIFTIRLGGSVQ